MAVDPRHLVQLAVIIEEGSFSAAADRLHLTQPALSRNIKLLEDRVGFELIDRSKKKIEATASGQVFAAQGQAIRLSLMQIERYSKDITLGNAGQLRIGATPLTTDFILRNYISDFLYQNPNIRLTLKSKAIHVLIEKLNNGELDIVIGPTIIIDKSMQLSVKPLWSDQLSIFCNSNHRLGKRKNITTQDLKDEKWIQHPKNSFIRAQMDSHLIANGLSELDVGVEVDSIISAITLIQESPYLTMLPSFPLQSFVDSGKIIKLPVKSELPPRHTGMITQNNSERSPLVDCFSEYILEKIRPE